MKHGGNIFSYHVKYDFSANLNPLGMPAHVKLAVVQSAPLWERYPDPDCAALVRKLSEYEGVTADRIVCGNGADDLIYRIIAALRPGCTLLCAPTFSEYRKALEEQGCGVSIHLLREEDSFTLTESFLNALTPALDMAILCTPNNPTGQCISAGLLQSIAERCCENEILLLLDGCFLDFTKGGGHQHNALLRKKVILLKAFTKSFAMPGLRLGYALFGDVQTAEEVKRTGQFWSVSAPAQAAGLAALAEQGYLGETRTLVRRERDFLTGELRNMGITVYPSDANFLLIRSKPGLAAHLLREKILVRTCDDFEGLDERYCRIAVRTHAENEALIKGVRKWIYG